jgi:hypothetical protein
MSGPSSRSSDPSESGPVGRPRGEAYWTAGGAQAISAPAKVARQSSQAPRVLAYRPSDVRSEPSCERAIRVSIGSVPRVAHRPSVPNAAARPHGPSIPQMNESAPIDVRVAWARFTRCPSHFRPPHLI